MKKEPNLVESVDFQNKIVSMVVISIYTTLAWCWTIRKVILDLRPAKKIASVS